MSFDIGAEGNGFGLVVPLILGDANDTVAAYFKKKGCTDFKQVQGIHYLKKRGLWQLAEFGFSATPTELKVVINGLEQKTTLETAMALGTPVRSTLLLGRRRRPDEENAEMLSIMWQSRAWTDAVVTCGTKMCPVHRAVLAAKSSVRGIH